MLSLIRTLLGFYSLTATVVHIWTVVIAFQVGGFWPGVLSLFLPALSEIYWMYQLWESHPAYAITALVHILLALPVYAMRGR